MLQTSSRSRGRNSSQVLQGENMKQAKSIPKQKKLKWKEQQTKKKPHLYWRNPNQLLKLTQKCHHWRISHQRRNSGSRPKTQPPGQSIFQINSLVRTIILSFLINVENKVPTTQDLSQGPPKFFWFKQPSGFFLQIDFKLPTFKIPKSR